MNASNWIDVEKQAPEAEELAKAMRTKRYVLAVDAKGRMSVGYAYRHSTGELGWVFAKPIGSVTHWMPLPSVPGSDDSGALPLSKTPAPPAVAESVDPQEERETSLEKEANVNAADSAKQK